MTAREVTSRGFRVYGYVGGGGDLKVRVQESSRAGVGAHVWLFLEGEECVVLNGEHIQPAPHLSVEGARELRDALDTFIREAEAGELTEPAVAPPKEDA